MSRRIIRSLFRGRVWRTMEDQNGQPGWGRAFRAFVMSAPADADLLDAASWTRTNILASSTAWRNGQMNGWLEGNIVAAPDGSLKNILRVDTDPNQDDIAAVNHISADGSTASFDPAGRPDLNPGDASGFITLPGATKKFVIRRDPETGEYWSLTSHILPQDLGGNPERTRNTLALVRSDDLYNWEIRSIVLHHPGVADHGFHYVDWQFEGDDLAVLSRSAWNANSQHDANLITFHRVENFRELGMADSVPSGEAGWELGDFTVEGTGFRPALLGNGERAFSNRNYAWNGVPQDLAGSLIMRSNGSSNPEIVVTAKHATTLRVATADPAGPPGWTAEGPRFTYSDGGNTAMHVFSRPLAGNESITIPQLAWSGTLPLIPSPHGLLAWWRFDDAALPAVADSHHAFHAGTIDGAGPRPVQGVSGAALDFSNAGSPVNGGAMLGLVEMDFTLSTWIRVPPDSPFPNQWIIGKGNSVADASWLLSLNSAEAGKVSFSAGNPRVTLTSATPVNDGRWHHVAISFTRAGEMTLHVNGSPAQDSVPAPVIGAVTGPFSMGGPGIPSFRGALDEVQLHDRALGPAAIASLFLDPSSPRAAGGSLPTWLEPDGDGMVLIWPGIPGRNYEVYRSTSLSGSSWQRVAEIEADSDWINWKPAIEGPRAFYRIDFIDP